MLLPICNMYYVTTYTEYVPPSVREHRATWLLTRNRWNLKNTLGAFVARARVSTYSSIKTLTVHKSSNKRGI